MVVPFDSSDATVVLVVPADAEFLHILRTLTAGVASMLDIPYDTLDDQRIAVAEAANLLLARAPESTSLTLRLWPSSESLIISVEATGPAGADERLDATAGFSWTIIQRLADSVEESASDGRSVITMRWATLGRHPA